MIIYYISNSIKHKVELEFKKREEEEKALEETKEKSAQDVEIDSKEGNDEETIDTASKGKSNSAAIQEEIMKREEEQVKLLVKRVVEKSELLIKLATPESWDRSDNSDKNLRKIEADEEEEVDNKEENIVTKLNKIKTIQASEGTVTSFENLSHKSIFTSWATSVLACLQCSISAKQIMLAIEEKNILTQWTDTVDWKLWEIYHLVTWTMKLKFHDLTGSVALLERIQMFLLTTQMSL